MYNVKTDGRGNVRGAKAHNPQRSLRSEDDMPRWSSRRNCELKARLSSSIQLLFAT